MSNGWDNRVPCPSCGETYVRSPISEHIYCPECHTTFHQEYQHRTDEPGESAAEPFWVWFCTEFIRFWTSREAWVAFVKAVVVWLVLMIALTLI